MLWEFIVLNEYSTWILSCQWMRRMHWTHAIIILVALWYRNRQTLDDDMPIQSDVLIRFHQFNKEIWTGRWDESKMQRKMGEDKRKSGKTKDRRREGWCIYDESVYCNSSAHPIKPDKFLFNISYSKLILNWVSVEDVRSLKHRAHLTFLCLQIFYNVYLDFC